MEKGKEKKGKDKGKDKSDGSSKDEPEKGAREEESVEERKEKKSKKSKAEKGSEKLVSPRKKKIDEDKTGKEEDEKGESKVGKEKKEESDQEDKSNDEKKKEAKNADEKEKEAKDDGKGSDGGEAKGKERKKKDAGSAVSPRDRVPVTEAASEEVQKKKKKGSRLFRRDKDKMDAIAQPTVPAPQADVTPSASIEDLRTKEPPFMVVAAKAYKPKKKDKKALGFAKGVPICVSLVLDEGKTFQGWIGDQTGYFPSENVQFAPSLKVPNVFLFTTQGAEDPVDEALQQDAQQDVEEPAKLPKKTMKQLQENMSTTAEFNVLFAMPCAEQLLHDEPCEMKVETSSVEGRIYFSRHFIAFASFDNAIKIMVALKEVQAMDLVNDSRTISIITESQEIQFVSPSNRDKTYRLASGFWMKSFNEPDLWEAQAAEDAVAATLTPTLKGSVTDRPPRPISSSASGDAVKDAKFGKATSARASRDDKAGKKPEDDKKVDKKKEAEQKKAEKKAAEERKKAEEKERKAAEEKRKAEEKEKKAADKKAAEEKKKAEAEEKKKVDEEKKKAGKKKVDGEKKKAEEEEKRAEQEEREKAAREEKRKAEEEEKRKAEEEEKKRAKEDKERGHGEGVAAGDKKVSEKKADAPTAPAPSIAERMKAFNSAAAGAASAAPAKAALTPKAATASEGSVAQRAKDFIAAAESAKEPAKELTKEGKLKETAREEQAASAAGAASAKAALAPKAVTASEGSVAQRAKDFIAAAESAREPAKEPTKEGKSKEAARKEQGASAAGAKAALLPKAVTASEGSVAQRAKDFIAAAESAKEPAKEAKPKEAAREEQAAGKGPAKEVQVKEGAKQPAGVTAVASKEAGKKEPEKEGAKAKEAQPKEAAKEAAPAPKPTAVGETNQLLPPPAAGQKNVPLSTSGGNVIAKANTVVNLLAKPPQGHAAQKSAPSVAVEKSGLSADAKKALTAKLAGGLGPAVGVGGSAIVARKNRMSSIGGGGLGGSPGAEKCSTCGKTVYLTERIMADGLVFHKMGCFKCGVCNSSLKLGNYASLEGKYYCKPHFKQLFMEKGNYSEGFGEETPADRWKRNQGKTPSGSPGVAHREEEETGGDGKLRHLTKGRPMMNKRRAPTVRRARPVSVYPSSKA